MHAKPPSPIPREALARRIAFLFPGLAAASAATLERIAERSTLRVVPAGTTVFSEHSPCIGFPLVLAGTVRVTQLFPNGRELQLFRVQAGESCLLSGSCLLGKSNYPANAVTVTEVEFLVIPPDEFRALIGEEEAFRAYVFGLFGDRLATLFHLVEAVAYQKLDQRLATMLAERSRAGHHTVNVTHQVLADELGSVREIVTRLLHGFEDRGWVRLGRERIEIRDLPALESLARS
jgi:CRP/FNR family transcriptional regulator